MLCPVMQPSFAILILFLAIEDTSAYCFRNGISWYQLHTYNNATLNRILCRRGRIQFLNSGISNIYTQNYYDYKNGFSLQLNDINFSTLDGMNSHLGEKVIYLDVQNNRGNIDSNTFALLKNCKIIKLSASHLNNVVGFNNSELLGLILKRSNIKNITNICQYTPKLHVLKLPQNRLENITKFTFEKCIKLTTLDLSDNLIETIEVDMFQGLENLHWLYLNRNRLTYIPSNAFNCTETLRGLYIQGNKIKEINIYAFFRLHELNRLYIQDNAIKNIKNTTFSSLSNLKFLNLSNAGIVTIELETFLGLFSLENLDLSSNLINFLPQESFSKLSSIRNLNLAKSNLKILKENQFAGLDNLRYLDISGSNIKTIENGALNLIPKLEKFDLSFNLLTKIPCNISYTFLENMQYLYLFNNSITRLEICTFTKFPFLKELYIQNNLIESLNIDTFVFLHNLTFLNVSNNKLKYLDDNFIKSLCQLRSLRLLELNCKETNNSLSQFRDKDTAVTAKCRSEGVIMARICVNVNKTSKPSVQNSLLLSLLLGSILIIYY